MCVCTCDSVLAFVFRTGTYIVVRHCAKQEWSLCSVFGHSWVQQPQWAWGCAGCSFQVGPRVALWPPGVQKHAAARLQHREALCLVVAGAAAHLCLVLRGGEALHRPSSGQDHQGVPRHAPELEGESPVEEHDEHAVDPLKDGGGVLQGEALLAEEDSTWGSEVKENNGCTAGGRGGQWTHRDTKHKAGVQTSFWVFLKTSVYLSFMFVWWEYFHWGNVTKYCYPNTIGTR